MRPVRKADNLTTTLCRCHEIWELSGPLQACNGTALPYMFRASMCPSSGENYCIHASLVLVTLYGWLLVCWLDWKSNQHTKYQGLMDTIIFSWWWAHGCPKYVEKRNKCIKQNCAPSWTYLQDYTGMHGQQNIIISTSYSCMCYITKVNILYLKFILIMC